MKKLLLTLSIFALALVSAPQAQAVKASRTPVEYVQPDGTKISIVLHGDEFHHWTTTENGTPLKLGADMFYREAASIDFESPNAARRRQMAAEDQERNRTMLSEGSHKFLVLLIEFSDLKFTVDNPQQAFYNLLNEPGYSANGGTGSAKDFYTENSSGQFNPEFDVYGPITLSKGYAYYGGNDSYGDDKHPDEALYEACGIIDPELDFSQYDQDGDGYVDNVFFYYAGHNEAENGGADTIWPHQWSLYYYTRWCDGVRIYRYACSSEYRSSYGSYMCGIGTFCHEFGHVIGLPDFYDTNYDTNGYSDPLGSFSLMDNGSYNNSGRTPPYLSAMERYLLGWMGKADVIETKGRYTLPPIREQQAYYVKTSNPGETFLLETRDGKNWDKYNAKGMLVYHVDHSSNNVHGSTAKSRWDNWNGLNIYSDHNCYYIKWAKSSYSENYAPFPGSGNVRTFTGTSWAGDEAQFALYDISFDGTNTYFSTKLAQSRIMDGTVSDYWGLPVEDVTVKAFMKDGTLLGTVQTDKKGYYSFDVTEIEEKEFSIEISKDGYSSRSADVIVTTGTVTRNFQISSVWDPETIENGKAGDFAGTYGIVGTNSMMGAVRYTAAELSGKNGYTIGEISFLLADSDATKVYVLVESGSERVLTKQVTAPMYGGWNTVDISSSNISIPEGKDIWVGFAVQGSKSGKPFGIDGNAPVDGSSYVANYTTGKGSWQAISEGNILINFTIAGPANPLRKLGYSYISRDEEGDFIIVPGKGLTPKTVEIKNNGSDVTATVEYTNGVSEVLTLEL